MISFNTSVLPDMYRIRQCKNIPYLQHPEQEIEKQVQPHLCKIKKGQKIGIAVGSRGIYQYAQMVKVLVNLVKSREAIPYLIPAMGSHGGATAEGQIEVLHGYGISPETMGADILSSMETIIIGETPYHTPVHFDKNAASMDGIIMINRVKPHTDFHGEIESGIMKQMAIGLGKQKGAETIHRRGIFGLANVMPASARVILEKEPILFGVAILENEEDKTAYIEVLAPPDLEQREKLLLKKAKSLLPHLPCTDLDVLVLEEMGKNISGTGIDPNIVGRYLIRGMNDLDYPTIYRIVCLSLTKESHHNAIGVGIADIITKQMYESIDLEPTYINTVTSGFLERGFLPFIAENDQTAITTALHCANRYVTKENARMIIAKNTLYLKELIVSKALLSELSDCADIEILEKVDLDWDEKGYFKQSFFSK